MWSSRSCRSGRGRWCSLQSVGEQHSDRCSGSNENWGQPTLVNSAENELTMHALLCKTRHTDLPHQSRLMQQTARHSPHAAAWMCSVRGGARGGLWCLTLLSVHNLALDVKMSCCVQSAETWIGDWRTTVGARSSRRGWRGMRCARPRQSQAGAVGWVQKVEGLVGLTARDPLWRGVRCCGSFEGV